MAVANEKDDFFKNFNQSALKGGQKVVVSQPKETQGNLGELKVVNIEVDEQNNRPSKKEKKKNKKKGIDEGIKNLAREVEARKEQVAFQQPEASVVEEPKITEMVVENKSFYNPIKDLKIAYDLVEDESGFIKYGEPKADSAEKTEAKKRLADNEFDLSIVEVQNNLDKRKLAKRVAEAIKSLLDIYVESWIESNNVLSKFMGVNADRLKREKVVEETKKTELGEPVFYDQIFEDLYLSVQEVGFDGKAEAIERLRENNISAKQYDKNSEKDRQNYLQLLKDIHERKAENIQEKELKVLQKHKLDKNPEVLEKYKKEPEVKEPEAEKIWDKELFDELEAGTSGTNSDKEFFNAREKLKKRGIDLENIAKTESKEVQKKLLSAIDVVKKNKPDENFISVDLAKQEITKYFKLKEEEKKEVFGLLPEPKVEEKEKLKTIEDFKRRCNPERWEIMMKIIKETADEAKKKSLMLGLMACHYQLDHPESREATNGNWERAYSPMLEFLGVNTEP